MVADEFLDLDADDFMFEDEKAAAEAGGGALAQEWVGELKIDSLQKLLAMAAAAQTLQLPPRSVGRLRLSEATHRAEITSNLSDHKSYMIATMNC